MSLSDTLYIVVAVLFSGCCRQDESVASSAWKEVPTKLMSIESAHTYARKINSLVDYLFVLDLASTYGDEEHPEPLESIILLWCQGFRTTVESLWFEKDDRVARSLIMLLILSDKEDDRLDSYIVKCNRFERHECDQRREEILFVERNREEFSRLVKRLEEHVRIAEMFNEEDKDWQKGSDPNAANLR